MFVWHVGLLGSLSELLGIVLSIPVQNSVFGEIEVECDSRVISIQIKTENPFIGTLFVKDFALERACSSKGNGRLSAFLEVEIGGCGVFRQRTLNPRGSEVRMTITISFHPLFITKVDRTYNLLCIYKEAEVPVHSSLSAEDISTISVFHNLSMPVCTYQILDGGPNGVPVQFGSIGQQVYHKWQCDTENVHTCSADDGRGDRAFLIDSNGCAIDRFLLSDIEYPDNLLAGQEAHVYKFADREALFFQCQISITVKEPGEECARPLCSESHPEVAGSPAGGFPYDGKQKKTHSRRLKRDLPSETLDISLPGFLINIYVFLKLSTRKRPFSGFHKLCIVKAIPNSVVCFTFLVWSTPLCALHPKYELIPRSVNVGFGQVAGWGAYILGPLLQVCMSFNRFYVLYFPMHSLKVSNFPVTNLVIGVAASVAVIYTVIGFPEECGFVFDSEILSWRPEDFDCAAWLADFIFFSILSLSIISNSLNFATFLKLVSSRVEGVSSGDSISRRKRRISMYIQSVLQDTLHLIDMINCTILFKLNSAIWYQFIFLSISFLSIHALDGSVMFYFHTEIHPQWLLKIKQPKSRTGTLFVSAVKSRASFHISA